MYTVFHLKPGNLQIAKGKWVGPAGTPKARGLLEDDELPDDAVLWRLARARDPMVLIAPGEVATLDEARGEGAPALPPPPQSLTRLLVVEDSAPPTSGPAPFLPLTVAQEAGAKTPEEEAALDIVELDTPPEEDPEPEPVVAEAPEETAEPAPTDDGLLDDSAQPAAADELGDLGGLKVEVEEAPGAQPRANKNERKRKRR